MNDVQKKDDRGLVFRLLKKNAYKNTGMRRRFKSVKNNSLKVFWYGDFWKERLKKRALYNKEYQNTAKYIIFDTHTVSTTKEIGSSPFSFGMSVLKRYRNVKNSQEKTKKAKGGIRKEAKLVFLNRFGALFIGNFEAITDANSLKQLNIKTVINLSTLRCRSNEMGNDVEMISVYFPDVHSITFDQFLSLVAQVNEIIAQNKERGGIAIVCESGVNKAVSATIGHLLMQKLSTFEKALDYIDTKKLQKYKVWDSLTVVRLRNYLRALESRP